jgi:hypothetical protein
VGGQDPTRYQSAFWGLPPVTAGVLDGDCGGLYRAEGDSST